MKNAKIVKYDISLYLLGGYTGMTGILKKEDCGTHYKSAKKVSTFLAKNDVFNPKRGVENQENFQLSQKVKSFCFAFES